MQPSTLRANQRNRYQAMHEFAFGATAVASSPPSLQIARSNHCNFKCAYCGDHRVGNVVPRMRLEGDVWHGLLDLIPVSTTMAFHGISEFLLDPEFFDIVDRCAAAGVELSINTNGSVCTPKFVDAFVRYPGPLYVNVSIDAASAATYTRIRGFDFARLLRNIETYVAAFRARKALTKTTLSYVICASNMHETGAVVRLAAALGVQGVKFYRLHENPGLDWVIPTKDGTPFDYHQEHTTAHQPQHDAAVDDAERVAAELGIEIEVPARYAPKVSS